MFDVTKTYSIDLSSYLKKYNIINSSLQTPEIEFKQVVNYVYYQNKIDISNITDDYILSITDRPDTLSLKLYDTTDYWWVNLAINNISYYDFPLDEISLNSLANYLYREYREYSLDTYIQFLENMNVEKRKIKIIKPENIIDFMKELGGLIV